MRAAYWLTAGSLAIAGVRALDLIVALGELPSCGIECFTTVISTSACTDITNSTCICNDEGFHNAAEACIVEKCSPVDALNVAKIEAQACERPTRSRKTNILSTLAIEIPAWTCLWLRVYSRYTTFNQFAIDDYLMMVCGVFYTVFVVLGASNGYAAFGVDTWTLEPHQITQGLKVFYIDETFYLACLCLTKISILCFYLRIFPNQGFRFAAYTTMAFVIFPTIIFIFLQIFQCVPVSYIWEGWADTAGKANCLNLNALAFAAASTSIIQDAFILVLPLPLLLKLKTGRRTKAGVMFMFSLGIFVLITSCVRLRYLVSFGSTTNPCWDFTDPLIWTALETAVSVIVACLPAIRVLVQRAMPGMFSVFSRASASGYVKEPESSLSAASRQRFSKARSEPHPDMFGVQTDGVENESQIELSLRLGDKERGEVQTEIFGGPRSSMRTPEGMQIRVMTTTTTTDIDPHRFRFGGDSGDDKAGRSQESSTPSLPIMKPTDSN